jgi:hypothetical protein
MNDDHGERDVLKVLLILKLSVHCEKNIELNGSTPQQFSILHAGLADLGDGRDLMAGDVATQRTRNALVK